MVCFSELEGMKQTTRSTLKSGVGKNNETEKEEEDGDDYDDEDEEEEERKK